MIKEMKYFYAVYEKKSFSKAAASLFITQPALSTAIKNLEAEVGVQLFDRTTTPLSVTPAGEYYARAAEQVFSVQRDLQEYFSKASKLEGGRINLGASEFYCQHTMPIHMQPFLHQYPGISINLEEYNSPKNLERDLRSGKLDIVISSNHVLFHHYHRVFFCKEDLILVVPSRYSVNKGLEQYQIPGEDILKGRTYYSSRYPSVSIRSFSSLPFLSLRDSNDQYHRSQEIFRSAGVKPIIYMYFDQMATLFHLATLGYGYSIIRDETLKVVPPINPANPSVYFYQLDDALTVRDVFLFCKADSSPAVDAFLRYTEETCSPDNS